jgi:hypothetical protein
MKLSRRGKRTKCAKRTKRFKLKRNTKKQFRQYKRKNTYRKHSHKLRKNKRVMRGGVENVTLEYTTSDSFSKFKNLFGSLQKGTFTVELTFHGSLISETSKGNETMKSTLDHAVKMVNHQVNSINSTQTFQSYFIPETPDVYNFTLIMKKDDKEFEVKFVVKVKKYNFRLFKIKNPESYGIDFTFTNGPKPVVLGDNNDYGNEDKNEYNGITYSSGANPTTFNNYEIMNNNPQPFTIVPTGQPEKKYMFRIEYVHGHKENNSFFSSICSKMIENILKNYKVKLLAVLNQSLQQQTPQHIAPEVNDNTKLAASNTVSIEEEVSNDE